MPIYSPIRIEAISREEFAKLDYLVMHHAFAAHRKLGRLCDESIYKEDLAKRLRSAGLASVLREVPVRVTYRDFEKTYQLDLVVEKRAVYEAKTAASFVDEHDAQQLNYLYLVDGEHGKLINFRPEEVESRFVNNPLTPEARRQFKTDLSRWVEANAASEKLRLCLLALLSDWGGFLELALYQEALIHFLGGEEAVCKMIPLTRDEISLGHQRFQIISPDTGFRLTALPGENESYENHLRALLRLSPLSRIQWINLGRHIVEFVTVLKR